MYNIPWLPGVVGINYGRVFADTKLDPRRLFEDSHIALDTASKLGMKTVGIYDKYNYGQDEIKKIATVYIAEGKTLKGELV